MDSDGPTIKPESHRLESGVTSFTKDCLSLLVFHFQLRLLLNLWSLSLHLHSLFAVLSTVTQMPLSHTGRYNHFSSSRMPSVENWPEQLARCKRRIQYSLKMAVVITCYLSNKHVHLYHNDLPSTRSNRTQLEQPSPRTIFRRNSIHSVVSCTMDIVSVLHMHAVSEADPGPIPNC